MGRPSASLDPGGLLVRYNRAGEEVNRGRGEKLALWSPERVRNIGMPRVEREYLTRVGEGSSESMAGVLLKLGIAIASPVAATTVVWGSFGRT